MQSLKSQDTPHLSSQRGGYEIKLKYAVYPANFSPKKCKPNRQPLNIFEMNSPNMHAPATYF